MASTFRRLSIRLRFLLEAAWWKPSPSENLLRV
jgi:hypothetical protein